jgi:predicted peroxiredoxin
MSKILVHVTNGPEQPTRAALAFLVAKAATDVGICYSATVAFWHRRTEIN